MSQPTPPPLRRSSRRGPKPVPGRTGRYWVQYAVIFVTFLLVVNAVFGERGLLATLRIKKQYAEISRSVAAIRAENARLLETVRRLQSDPAAVEEAARRDLGLMDPDEVLVIIRDVEPTGQPAETAPAPPTPSAKPENR